MGEGEVEMMVVHNPAFHTSLTSQVSKGFTVSSSRLGRASDGQETETAFGVVYDGGGHDEAVVRKTCPSRLLTYAAFFILPLCFYIVPVFWALAVPASLSSPDNADPLLPYILIMGTMSFYPHLLLIMSASSHCHQRSDAGVRSKTKIVKVKMGAVVLLVLLSGIILEISKVHTVEIPLTIDDPGEIGDQCFLSSDTDKVAPQCQDYLKDMVSPYVTFHPDVVRGDSLQAKIPQAKLLTVNPLLT